jgi:4a-hydroxytetrahydrobiopterin dehydratase
MTEPITPREFEESEGVGEWRVLGEGACTFFRTSSFEEGARLVQAIGGVAGVAEHPPAIDIRADGVTARLITTDADYRGMTHLDVEIARGISAAAHALGLVGDPSSVQIVTVIPGWTQPAAIMPFWQAILGYERRPDSPDEDLIDPHDLGPAFWFEPMDEPRADGGGAIHLAVWVPAEQAVSRVQAAMSAGGRLVRDTFAPAWWTLADAAGNEADVATTSGRD